MASTRPDSTRPPWLKIRLPCRPPKRVDTCLDDLKLHTVCRSARCPNTVECYAKGRATFLLMGPNCTRHCGFCAVSREPPAPLDPTEPARVAEAVKRLELTHAVVTSVTRDDLPDGGAAHFAATVAAVRAATPQTTIEILTPDFRGERAARAVAADSLPEVFNHNVETVPRLYAQVRPQADYRRSLELLAFVKHRHPGLTTKSGLMLGLGETEAEVLAVGNDLREAGVDMLTVGQYLQPSRLVNLPVQRYVPPEEFATLRQQLSRLGFGMVAAAPFVRSSYNAEEAFSETREERE